ncbi:MAG TPA: TlpA disulfide reductase family protein [Fimbriiglobus sp.]|nr:TlpA disulfide reductase family protein [Fimbriiglobus sp.]
MRTVIATLLTVGLAATATAQAPPKKLKKLDAAKAIDDEKKEAKSLKVGDPAPKLKATKWLQGAEVAEFAPGKTYVVEFWATWCGPCIAMMPHMSAMQKEYKDKGVTFIGFTKQDRSNTAEKVAAFVAKRGPKLGYTFAYADDAETYDAYMKAAKQGGIPCSYVVDKEGKVAFIGHPMFLALVIPKVVEGKWGKDDLAGLAMAEKDVDAVFAAFPGRDVKDEREAAERGLKALNEFDAKYPALGDIPYFVGPRLGMLITAKKFDEAKTAAEKAIATAVGQDDTSMLQSLSGALAADKDRKDLLKLSVEAAESAVKLAGGKDPISLYYAAQANHAAGDKAKAKEYGQKAIAAADNDGLKKTLERLVKEFDKEEKKDDKKDK